MRTSRLLVLSLAAMIFSFGVNAQSVKGQNFLNAGIGVGTFSLSGTGGIPLIVSAEHGFADQVSAGVVAGFVKTRIQEDYHYSYYIVGARGSYHFNELLNVNEEGLDIYGGASLFYRGYKARYKNFNGTGDLVTSGGGIDFGIHAGARYMFAGNVGAFAELGYGISPLHLGVSVRF